MKKQTVSVTLGRDGVVITIPLEVITAILKPRIEFANPMNFTRREMVVLEGVIKNLGNKEIASELNLSERTIKFHVSSLLVKANVKSRHELREMYAGVVGTGERK